MGEILWNIYLKYSIFPKNSLKLKVSHLRKITKDVEIVLYVIEYFNNKEFKFGLTE